MTRLNGIPVGHYCYINDTSIKIEGDYFPILLCPYWQRTKDGVRCEYLGEEAKEGDDLLIWDQVKECGVNLPNQDSD